MTLSKTETFLQFRVSNQHNENDNIFDKGLISNSGMEFAYVV